MGRNRGFRSRRRGSKSGKGVGRKIEEAGGLLPEGLEGEEERLRFVALRRNFRREGRAWLDGSGWKWIDLEIPRARVVVVISRRGSMVAVSHEKEILFVLWDW